MKVLSSYPDGRAAVAALGADLAILGSSGKDWTDRMKRLAARAPELDIFSQRLVLRDVAGWQLTETGRQLLLQLEAPCKPLAIEQSPLQTAEADLLIELPRVRSMAFDGARAVIEPIRREPAHAAPISNQRRFAVIAGGRT